MCVFLQEITSEVKCINKGVLVPNVLQAHHALSPTLDFVVSHSFIFSKLPSNLWHGHSD